MHAKAQQTNALIAGSAALQTERGPVNRFLLVEPEGKVHFTINATCSAWLMNIIIMKPVTSAWCSSGAAGVFCRWSAMTCASRYGRATATITTGAVRRQLARAARCTGRRCWWLARLRTGVRGGL